MPKKNYKEENILESYLHGPTYGYADNYPNRALWKEIATELGAEFNIKHNSSQEIEIHALRFPHKDWELVFTVSDSRPWRCLAKFDISQEFNLMLSWEGVVERILKIFRPPEVKMGSKNFDRRYLIESNRPDLVKKVLNRDIQATLLKYNIYSISIQSDMEERTAELLSVIQRNVGNKEMILELASMYKAIVDKLFESSIIR